MTTRQTEVVGHSWPMWPSAAIFTTATPFVAPVDTAGTPTWTGSDREITPVLSQTLMNATLLNGDSYTVDGNTVILLPGQYRIDMHPTVGEGSGSTNRYAIAIGNGDGTVIYAESAAIRHLGTQDAAGYLTALVHITERDITDVDAQITFRALSRTGASMDFANQIATITKIGQVNQAT